MRKLTRQSEETTIVPDGAIGPFLPVSEWDISLFNYIISGEVNSAFTTSICCCDSCYDDFLAHWPGVAFRSMDFQTNSIEIGIFIDGSRITYIYSPSELSTLQHFGQCPRCNEFIIANMWLYEHRFSDSDTLEHEIDTLGHLADRTPFLMLENSFARTVLESVRHEASVGRRTTLPPTLFRARTRTSMDGCNQSPNEIGSFGTPPAERVTEGRFNHAGSPMLYLASSAQTAIREISSATEDLYVAELAFMPTDLLILDLVDLDDDAPSFELFSAVASSALLAAPRKGTGWLRRQYVFSRFFADCAKSAGFDTIRYGSTKDDQGSNYVLLEPNEPLEALARLISWKVWQPNRA